MLGMFQTEQAIKEQLENGYKYFFVCENNRNIGFLAFYPKGNSLYLSKFYLYKSERGKGYAHKMMEFVIYNAKELNLTGVELNVNKQNSACCAYERLGFKIIRSEKTVLVTVFIWMIMYIVRKYS